MFRSSDATVARLSRTPYGVMEDFPKHLLAAPSAAQPPAPAAAAPVPAAEDPVAEAEIQAAAEDAVPVPVPQVEDEEESQLPPFAVKDMNVLVVQDISGSMESQRVSVATGINEIFGDMQKRYREPCEHKATVCIIKFSSHDNITASPVIPISEAKPITMRDLVCDGMTAMWDATAIAIDHMNKHSAGVPATTYIFTDGDDNDSKMHTRSSVNEMIADNKKRNPMHSVLFIGSDPTTKRNAQDIGIDRVHSIQHDANSTPIAYEVCRRALGRCVSGDTQSTEFTQEDIAMSETPQHQHEPQTPRTPHTPPHHTDSQVSDSQLSEDDYAFASDDVPSRTFSSYRR